MSEQSRPHLSIVIPAYNEERRLPGTLSAVRSFLNEKSYSAEVILADDGSDDNTAAIADAFTFDNADASVLRLPHQGKAIAVRAGMLSASGTYVMFTDADLSTPLEYVDRLLEALECGADVAIGTREGEGALRHGEPFYRHLMGRVFNSVVRLLAVPGINDTQCGFKAFRHEVASDVFSSVKLYGDNTVVSGPRVTGFDVEVLFLARKRGYRIVQVPVEWTHVAGSKVAPLSDSVRMFLDVLRVRWYALRGRYS